MSKHNILTEISPSTVFNLYTTHKYSAQIETNFKRQC